MHLRHSRRTDPPAGLGCPSDSFLKANTPVEIIQQEGVRDTADVGAQH
jgi:hypothetical protein